MDTPIHSVDAVPLDRHAVLEASAGTGKTFTLERLVLRLLTERRITLDRLLLVTYTEKATGELRGRLRKTLEDEVRRGTEHKSLLQDALDDFDQAPIYTIHAFCQKVLQEHAFDHRLEFRPRLVDDRELLHCCLREIQRKDWPAHYGDSLRAVLELSGYDARWERTVVDLAARVRPACGHRLLPAVADDWLAAVPALDEEVRDARVRLQSLVGPLDATSLASHRLLRAYAKADKAQTHQERRRAVLLPALKWLADASADVRPAAAFQALLHRCGKHRQFADAGFRIVTSKLKKAALAKLPPQIPDMLNILETLRASATTALPPHQLAVHTIAALQRRLDQYKRGHGLMSFEDMLTRMDQGLDPAHNPGAAALVGLLRRRFRYAIVDEFQDTDPVQWRILQRLFLEGGEGRLFVVGDPKQAIFNFRGADLDTYLTAKTQLAGPQNATVCTLDTNWRSSTELVAALNHVFEHGDWFAKAVAFPPVRPATNPAKRSAFVDQESDRAALTLVRIGGDETLARARRHFARFCADEIARLLRAAPRISAKGERRTLRADDICMLVHRRAEANPLVEELRRAQIPYSFYKQDGLWQSEEARHLGCLLKALARPEERQSLTRALLTRFFRIEPTMLAQCDDLPPRHPARLLFQQWADFAAERDWARLFDSLLDDSGLLHHELLREPDGERRLANYRHILHVLEQEGYSRGLDLHGLIHVFEARQARDGDVEGANYQPIETQRCKVKILTIHASKGLEYPVVFLAGGFTDRGADKVTMYRDSDRRVVFDLAPDDHALAEAKNERDAEQRRLYYVALTRAMVRVYVPWVSVTSGRQPGPLVSIVAPALGQSAVNELAAPVAHVLECPLRPRSGRGAARPLTGAKCAGGPPLRLDDPSLVFPRLDADLSRRRVVVRSFSSLHRQLALPGEDGPRFGERANRLDDDVPQMVPETESLRGPVFGDIVHAVLEQVDFAAVGRASTPEALLAADGPLAVLLEEQLARNLLRLRARVPRDALAELCRREVARLVWGALHTPLAALGAPLWQIPPEDCIAELEFHFPAAGEAPPPETQLEEGFLTGIMDLVVRRRGRFFLVDWKTNYLAGYTPAEVAQAMADCDYLRQYRLYVQALERWCRRRGDKVDFRRDFGGVYYLFLRGLNGHDETSGVWFHAVTAEDLRLERVLANQ